MMIADRSQDSEVDRAYAARDAAIAERDEAWEALRVLIQRVEHYAPSMERNGDLDEARAVVTAADAEWRASLRAKAGR